MVGKGESKGMERCHVPAPHGPTPLADPTIRGCPLVRGETTTAQKHVALTTRCGLRTREQLGKLQIICSEFMVQPWVRIAHCKTST